MFNRFKALKETAKQDFAEIRKAVKTIAKNHKEQRIERMKTVIAEYENSRASENTPSDSCGE